MEPGLSASATLDVTEQDTAQHLGVGDVPVLATPRVIALCEQASVRATEGRVPEGHTTVGTGVQISHVAPSGIGDTVTADATLDKIDGRRLVFTVSVSDSHGLVAAGKVTRVLVDRERFLERVG
jgi:predicted thioesterase